MRSNKIVYKIRKIFPAYMLGVLLIFSDNSQIVRASEGNQEVLTEKEQIAEETSEIPETVQIVGCVAVLAGGVVYIRVKKKHWFW